MKRLISLVLSCMMLMLTLAFAVSCSCGENEDPNQVHDCTGKYHFEKTKEVLSDCQNVGYVKYTCQTCGIFSYNVYSSSKGGHIFSDKKEVVVAPQIGIDGLKAKKCTVSGCTAWDHESEEPIKAPETDFPAIS